MIKIQLTFYGALKSINTQNQPFVLACNQPVACLDLREQIIESVRKKFPQFSESDLIRDSALADSERVFLPEDLITESCSLLILPPVCGG